MRSRFPGSPRETTEKPSVAVGRPAGLHESGSSSSRQSKRTSGPGQAAIRMNQRTCATVPVCGPYAVAVLRYSPLTGPAVNPTDGIAPGNHDAPSEMVAICGKSFATAAVTEAASQSLGGAARHRPAPAVICAA